MKLDHLENLYRDMTKLHIDRYRFTYTYGNSTFDVFFFADERPFTLLFGLRGENFSFKIEVQKGFIIKVSFDKDTYYKLIDFLKITSSSKNPFTPKSFLIDFNKHIPKTANVNNIPKPQEILRYRNNIEEAHKIYFWQWRNNTIRGQQVSVENLNKTKQLLGYQAYEICRNRNISSCWTDDSTQEENIIPPF